MKRLRLVTVAVVLSLCGCVIDADRTVITDFKPIDDSTFEYRASANPIQLPIDSEAAEAVRRRWLERYLTDNGFCPKGYEITQRRIVFISQVLVGPVFDIFYNVSCIH